MSIKLYGEFAKNLKSNGGRPAALFDKLDATNQAILTTLALHCWAEGKQPTVLQTMVILPAISTTTAHRRLKELRKLGWINLDLCATDNRVKYVVPTKLANTYFDAFAAAWAAAWAAAGYAA